MLQHLRTGIVRILDSIDRTIGVGFLSGERFVLTCDHVIAAIKRPDESQKWIDVEFPLLPSHPRLESRIVFRDEAADIAELELSGVLPAGTRPCKLVLAESLWGHIFRVFGFPQFQEQGVWATGRILSLVDNGWLQIEDVKPSGYGIQPGFSGAPVWDEKLGGVVGMVVASERQIENKTGFVIPTRTLIQARPKLKYEGKWPVSRLDSVAGMESDVPQSLQVGGQVHLSGTNYLVREIFAQRVAGNFILKSLRASNLTINQDVGIWNIVCLYENPEALTIVQRIANRAKIYGKAASQNTHLPRVQNIIEQSAGALWLIVEWISGISLNKIYSSSGSLPDASGLIRLIGWAVDVCEGLSTLHRRRISHPGISIDTILVTKGRGAVLIDPIFTTTSGNLEIQSPEFDPLIDIRNLAAAIYNLITRQPPQSRLASDFNQFVPPPLDHLLRYAIAGEIKQVSNFKNGLVRSLRMLQAR